MNKKQRTEAMAQEIRQNAEKAGDFQTIIDNLPPGQVKNLLKDPICGPILSKHGVSKSHETGW